MSQTSARPEHHVDERILLDDGVRGSVVTYLPLFLAQAEADALFTDLFVTTPFQAETLVMWV